jgi:hypothetical protein
MRYQDFIKEGYQGYYDDEEAANPEEFISMVQNFDADHTDNSREPGEGDGQNVIVKQNTVYIDGGDRRMGKLIPKGGTMMLMYADNEFIGVLQKGPGGLIDVFFYNVGYVGSNRNLKAALDTLMIAAWA